MVQEEVPVPDTGYKPTITPSIPDSASKIIKVIPVTNITPVKKPSAKIGIVPIINLTPVQIPGTIPGIISSPGKSSTIPGNPGGAKTTGLGSQVISPSEAESLGFGSFGSLGISGEGGTLENGGNGMEIFSGIPTIVWIGLACVAGYFLLK